MRGPIEPITASSRAKIYHGKYAPPPEGILVEVTSREKKFEKERD
jgi:hypothetical protein